MSTSPLPPTLRFLCPAFLLVSLIVGNVQAAEDKPIDYLSQVKPLLLEKCGSCHSARKQEAGLRLDTAAFAKQGGESGAAFVEGKSAQSILMERVLADEQSRMPPADSGSRLTDEQIVVLKAWIDQGAIAPADEPELRDPRKHWSFQPPQLPNAPAIDAAWVRTDLDRFLAGEHRRLGLQAVDQASRAVQVRRLYLNLTGLPPTREELQEFLADTSPAAWENTIDRLLNSPRYGERWARHFMDIWRYSDPSGYGKEIRDSREHIWRWRDWIIESLNEDKSYDRMITEMLAADEVAPDDLNALRATGFLARNWYKFNRNVWLDNIVEHSTKAFLGITINCTRCHEHKYDPLEQEEYYGLRAIFESHDVRDDPFPADSAALVRTYDAHHTRETYLFRQGDENNPDKETILSPAVPAVLGGELLIETVELPVFAYYPALKPENRQAAIANVKAEISKAKADIVSKQNELEAAQKALAEADTTKPENTVPKAKTAPKKKEKAPPQTPAQLASAVTIAEAAHKLAEIHATVTEREHQALIARAAAEEVKYDLTEGDWEQLAKAAAQADAELAIRKLEELLTTDHFEIATAAAKPESDAKAKQAAEAAKKNLETHSKQLVDAKAKRNTYSTSYQPLGPLYPKTSTGRRLALARWMTERRNPLTARVLVNHVWLRHFGTPLVERMFDFGLRSEKPQHLELLDWLAIQFMEDGWSLKRLHKRISLSGAYGLSSSFEGAAEANLAIDPDNHALWRMNARRMEAEVVRDSVLYLGGSLNVTAGGPPIPYTQGQTTLRRSLYFQQDKERQMTFLNLFDGAKVNECYRRTATVAPQQALAMFNSQIASVQSKKVASIFSSLDDEQFVSALFAHILSRPPSLQEAAQCSAFLHELAGSATARNQLALVLFNHNDFVTIR